MTKVIFRKLPDGDIVALFPQELGNMNPYSYCNSYIHVGQHGAASTDVSTWTKPATPEEYKDLLEELVSIGYDDLVIAKKFTRKDLEARIKALEDYTV